MTECESSVCFIFVDNEKIGCCGKTKCWRLCFYTLKVDSKINQINRTNKRQLFTSTVGLARKLGSYTNV